MNVNSLVYPSNMPQMLPGEYINEFKVVEILGEGGMAIVFRVVNTKTGNERALKVLKTDSNSIDKLRFQYEVDVARALSHPNIVSFYDLSFWNHTLIAEMEYVAGLPLDRFIHKYGPIEPTAALSICICICKAMEYAQTIEFNLQGEKKSGLVHRDIKPSNILLSNKGNVKLADFGIARIGQTSVFTESGFIPGTSAYQSPEQFLGVNPDHRGDIYSLGILLYEMLTTLRPFPEPSIAETFRARTKGEYVPLTKKAPGISKVISRIVKRCLKPNPEKRFQSYEQFRKELEKALLFYTSETPESILERYISDPKAEKAAFSNKKVDPKKFTRILMFELALLVILSIIFFQSELFTSLTKHKRRLASQKEKVSRTAIENSTESASQQEEQEYTIDLQKSNIVNKDKNTRLADAKMAKKPINDTNKTQIHKKVSDVEKIFEFYKKNQFTELIGYVNKLSLGNIQKAQRDSIVILLLDSYFRVGMVKDALSLLGKYRVDDGQYLAIEGLLYESLGRFDKATPIFMKVCHVPCIFGPTVGRQVCLTCARYFKNRYQENPDKEQQTLVINAYQFFIQNYCKHNSPECLEARKTLENLLSN